MMRPEAKKPETIDCAAVEAEGLLTKGHNLFIPDPEARGVIMALLHDAWVAFLEKV